MSEAKLARGVQGRRLAFKVTVEDEEQLDYYVAVTLGLGC